MTTVAIVGAGIAGLGAAQRLLRAGVDVDLFEASRHLGGDCFGVDVPRRDGGVVRIDAGVSDFNRDTFVRVGAFIDELGLPCRPIAQDASFMTPDRETAWFAGRGGMHHLAEEIQTEIARFRKSAVATLDDERYRQMTVAAYLDEQGYSPEFRRLYFDPRAAGAFPMPDADPASFPIRSVIAFWRMHGVVGHRPAHRMCIEGGMHHYGDRFATWFADAGGRLHTDHDIVGLVRRKTGVELRAITGDDTHLIYRADHVVIATNASDVLAMLEDPSAEEADVMPRFRCQRARLTVHRDPRLMPLRHDDWGAFNYLVARGDMPEVRPTITFYPKLLARLPDDVPDVFVTMNPFVEPEPASVISNRFFVHPVATGQTHQLASRIAELQGQRNTWYAGSYLIEPFVHEQALESGQRTADALLAALTNTR